ncbi:hypothetical protein FGI21_09395 [Dickeya zeae]|uniref:Uncharacterized protein n=1 Tax=Dickeya zeae TaxID=204042 RepID=A0ABX8VXU2_9GAMM|nr:hypothetical protein FGI21_09395 [Dickeya zeae]
MSKTHVSFYVSVIYPAKLPFPFNELTGFSPFNPLLTTTRCKSDFQNGERSHYAGFIHRQREKTSQKISKTSKTTVRQGCKSKQ